MPDLSETPTAQELANTVRKVLDPLTIHSFSEATAALAVLQARAEQADRLREALQWIGDEDSVFPLTLEGCRKRARAALAVSEEQQP